MLVASGVMGVAACGCVLVASGVMGVAVVV